MKICNEISVVFMPSNTTSILHPIDHRIISNFKFCYLRHVFHKALTAIDGDLSMDLGKVKLKTFWKGFTELDAIKNICDLWEEVKISTPKGFWKKLIPIPPPPMDDFGGSRYCSGGSNRRCGRKSKRTRLRGGT